MAELDFGSRSYHDVVRVTSELLRNGADPSACMGAIEHFDREVVSQMDDEQFTRFSGRVAWEGATSIISDSSADPTHAYTLLASQAKGVSRAQELAEYGKSLDTLNPRSKRSHTVLRIASDAFVEVWEAMQDQPLERRIRFYTEEYTRVASLQNWAGDLEGQAITAERIVKPGESLFAEAKSNGDERLISQMNDSLRDLAGYFAGGIENPKAQRLLRITSAAGKIFDSLKLFKLEDTADTLLKSGMIDAAFEVYKLTSSFDPDETRQVLKKQGKRSEEEIEEHIRLVTGSFPGSPWGAIIELQKQPDTDEYVAQILDRIKEEFPTTYERFSYGQYLRDHAAYVVLINVNRSEELVEIIRGNAKGDEISNLRFMAGRMAAMIMQANKQELYDKVFAATAELPGASEALQEGYNAVVASNDQD